MFCLSYSATHAKQNNLVYVLDALDAYNKRIVKKIEVKGFEVKNFRGTEKYLYLDNIIISSKKPPRAKIEFEISYNKSINRESRILDVGDNLYPESNEMEQYKDGFVISEINPISGNVAFVNGLVISKGTVVGDISEKDLRRIQIRETIASHSALREGWDNPNVFQICTLKHSDSTTQKRQEVGRGLRLCVTQAGDRIDSTYPLISESNIHDINKLTVIASESYKDFAAGLQKEIKAELYDRPSKATEQYFIGKTIYVDEKPIIIDKKQAKEIYRYLVKNDYTDEDDNVTDAYRTDLANNCLATLSEQLKPMVEGIHKLVQSVFSEKVLDDMLDNGNKPKVEKNDLNDNFYKKEFQTLWNYINHKYAYTVDFNSEELIEKAIIHVNEHIFVSELQYTVVKAEQKTNIYVEQLERGESFKGAKTRTETLKHNEDSQIEYDLVGKIATATTLTRKTIVAILKGLEPYVFGMFKNNPEEFITKAIKLIKEQKATMIVDHITYNEIEGNYDSNIFTAEKTNESFSKAYRAKRHIQDYVFTDGIAEKSIERKFAEELEGADEVCVYAKLPRGFQIPTPVGNYSPDWAIAFNEGAVKHIYFIAETKGSMDSMHLRKIEDAKIACAKKLFNELSTSCVKYHEVNSYETLLNVMGKF